MNLRVGDFCNLDMVNSSGQNIRTKGILIDFGARGDKDYYLFLLVVYPQADGGFVFQREFDVHCKGHDRHCGYTSVNERNLICLSSEPHWVGRVSPDDLEKIMVDIFESKVSQRIEQFAQSLETESFWTKFVMPKGMKVSGGFGKL